VIPYICRASLPPLLTGVVLSGVTAAIMSTADSQLMYAATSLVNDFWLKLGKRKEVDPKVLVRWTRVVLVVMTVVAMLVALVKIRLIYTFVLFAWGALGAAFTPIIVLALYWKGLTRQGALASLIVGPVVVIVWHVVPPLSDLIYELIPAFGLSLVAAIGVSLVTRR
jgi:SSS family solute:Na+ symporter